MKTTPEALLVFTLAMATFVVVSTSVAAIMPPTPEEEPALICLR
jgi:hypothetical protein